MRKKIVLLLSLTVSTQLASCSTVQDYIISATPTLFRQTQPLPNATPMFEYDFIQPRHTELSPDTVSKLNEVSGHETNPTYYSASGYRCYTLSLTSSQSACDINGQWVALAPILNY